MTAKKMLDKVINPPVYDYGSTIEIENKHNVYGDFDKLEKTEYIVKSFDGYELHCTYIPLKYSRKYVIISHDHSYTRMGSVKYMHMFRKLGFNCLIYDNRGCGKNASAPITMGYYESRDLRYIIADLREKFGGNIFLGLHGESMGAALSLMALKEEDNIDFVISDCAYADLNEQLFYNTKKLCYMPKFVVKRASKLCKKKYGFGFEDVKPYACIENMSTPICFIHGEDDDFILPSHCMTLYQAAGGYREINSFPGAGHAGSIYSNPERYERIVKNFLLKISREERAEQAL